MLEICFYEYNDLLDASRSKLDPKYGPTDLALDACDCNEWYKEKSGDSTVKGDEEELDDLPPPGDEEVKERKGVKIVTPNEL